jgi:hypothetical protein
MISAFDTNNYEAWKSLMEDRGRVKEVVTADNFSKFAEANKLAKEGKFDESKSLRAELGL